MKKPKRERKVNTTHVCECGETKLYFGKGKLCPICDEREIMLYSRNALRKNKNVICGIIKLRKIKK
jgi:hypothetical protein